MNEHLNKLQNQLPEGCEAALIESSVNRRYYTGMQSSAGTFLVMKDYAALVIDFRYIEKAKSCANGYDVVLQDKLYSQVEDIFKAHGVKRVAIEGDRMTVSRLAQWKKELPSFEFDTEGLAGIVSAHRRVKTAAELEIVRSAQAITDKTFAELLNFIKAGMTEREVRNELERLLMHYGAEKTAFDTISVSGKNSSLPHGVPSDKKICEGDFLTMDFGAVKNNYCSDMTRTVAIGHVSDEQRMVYETVLEAQKRALATIKAGVSCFDIDFAARDFIENQKGFKGCFGHGLGHSLGLEIHEDPRFAPHCKEPAQDGYLMSVEPGIYLEGKFGVRIEDIVVVREGGYENLTHSPKELIIL